MILVPPVEHDGGFTLPDSMVDKLESTRIPGVKPVGNYVPDGSRFGVRIDHWYDLGGTHTDLVTGQRAVYIDGTSGPSPWTHTVGTAYGPAAYCWEVASEPANTGAITLSDGWHDNPTEPTWWMYRIQQDTTAGGTLILSRNLYNSYGVRLWIRGDHSQFHTMQAGSNSASTTAYPTATDGLDNIACTVIVWYDPDGGVSSTGFTRHACNGGYDDREQANWVSPPTYSGTLFYESNHTLSGNIWLAAKGRGILSEAQCIALSLDPYQLLRPA